MVNSMQKADEKANNDTFDFLICSEKKLFEQEIYLIIT